MDERPQPAAVRLGAALGALALLCVAAGAVAWALRPPTLRTHQDLVAYALREQGVAYREIALGEVWPDRTNRQYGSYAGPISRTIKVRLADGSSVAGWLECRDLEGGCTLSLRDLGMRDRRLPDMGAPKTPAWLRWLVELR